MSRVRASTGNLVQTWTGATEAYGVLIARGKVFITGNTNPGSLYEIDPTQPAGPITTLTSALGTETTWVAYDGQHIWIAGSPLEKVTLNPLTVTDIPINAGGILYDGSNIWVTKGQSISSPDHLLKLDSNGNVLLDTAVGPFPEQPAFDGTNIWVPNHFDDSVTVVRAVGGLAGTVLATLSGNGLDGPDVAAFDGERILVTNFEGSVSLWKATDLTPIDHVSISGVSGNGACSDGVNFWITVFGGNQLARF